jgi:prepilin-type N-terminal cleavage/methylation domain-containing protein
MKKSLKNDAGFTLIEIMVVVAIIATMTALIIPRVSTIFNKNQEAFAITTGLIVRTFDDSFLKSKINFLAIYLNRQDPLKIEAIPKEQREIFNHSNALAVLELQGSRFVPSSRKMFKVRDFPKSFIFEKVLFASGNSIDEGIALIPFSPNGSSQNVIIHVLVNDTDRWSIKIDKFKREPTVIPGFIDFEDGRNRR